MGTMNTANYAPYAKMPYVQYTPLLLTSTVSK